MSPDDLSPDEEPAPAMPVEAAESGMDDASEAESPDAGPRKRRKKKKLPLVAICGRPNVGKSTLFNRIAGRQHAIVHHHAGITRDRAYAVAEHEGKRFRLVDTGGVVDEPVDPVTAKMQEQVREALREARVVLFVLDGQQEVTRVDEDVRDELFRLGKPVVLAINKVDNARLGQQVTDFYSLGLGEPVPISATHNEGIGELLDRVLEHVPRLSPEALAEAEEAELEGGPTKVAIVGKPNVGKSSFINALFNQERVIVTDVPGTTRDAIDNEFTYRGQDYVLIDTAGMRKKGNISYEVERYSVNRSLRAVNRADVALLMIDAIDGVTEQDKRILQYIAERGTGLALVFTKWDLVEDKERAFKQIADHLDRLIPFMKYVPYLTISNVTKQRVTKTLELVDEVAAEATKRIGTGELNRFFEKIREHETAAMRKGKRAKVLYATQASIKPTTFVLFVNQVGLFHFSYTRFIENRLREQYGFKGVPIKLELRAGDGRERPKPS